jgi:hypothetical protein
VSAVAERTKELEPAHPEIRGPRWTWSAAWGAFKRFARKVGDFQARFLLSVFYVFVVGPHALLMKLFADPLGLRATQSRGWIERSRPEPKTLDEIRRQF